LDTTDSETFSVSGFSSTLVIGNRGDYQRPGMITVHAFYVWDVEFDQTDVTSLDSSPYQMFNNPPNR